MQNYIKKIRLKDTTRTANCFTKLTALFEMSLLHLFKHLQFIICFVSPISLVASKSWSWCQHSLPNHSFYKFFLLVFAPLRLLPPTCLLCQGQLSPMFLSFVLVPPLAPSCGKLSTRYFFRSLFNLSTLSVAEAASTPHPLRKGK